MSLKLISILIFSIIFENLDSKALKLHHNKGGPIPVQAISVRGRFFCGDTPAIGIPVKLIDRDHGEDRDDLLDERLTDETGAFHVTGGTYEREQMEPALKFYHDCNDGEKRCQKRLFWDIPPKYLGSDLSRIPVFDLGTINLEVQFGNEKRDCKH